MQWTKPDKSDPRWGRQSGDFRVAKLNGCVAYLCEKAVADEGGLATLYRLWYKHDDLGWFADFESAKDAAKTHQNALSGDKNK